MTVFPLKLISICFALFIFFFVFEDDAYAATFMAKRMGSNYVWTVTSDSITQSRALQATSPGDQWISVANALAIESYNLPYPLISINWEQCSLANPRTSKLAIKTGLSPPPTSFRILKIYS
jgi:hypothetical protein